MADVDEFALAGLQRSRFLSNVRFQVQVRPDGTGIVRLTSNEVVREPFLSFLVEINWPNGRLVREYTVLLDPPVFNPAPIRRTVQPVVSAQMDVATIRQGQPVDIPPRPGKAVDNIRTRARSANQIYVGVNETLWRLAEKHRPDGSVTPTQMMVALQKKNPQAFFDNNLNRLKAGVVLDLPSLQEVQALTHQQAVAEVRRQTRLWKQGKSNKAPAVTPKRESKPAAKKVAPQAESGVGKLTITAPGSEEPVSDTAASGDGSEKDKQIEALTQRNQELQTRLNEALENADSASRENAQLSKRLDAIDEHLETLQKLLNVKDGEIAQLQAALADKEEVAATDSGKGILDYLTSPVALAGIGSALLALLGGGLFMLLRKRKKDAAEDDSGLVQVPGELKMSAIDEPEEAAATDKADDAEDLAEAEADSDMADLSDLEEVADLDLDMDLELSESDQVATDVADDALGDLLNEASDESRLDDIEFDLGLDEETEAVADQIAAETETLGSAGGADPLDEILGEADAFDGTDVDAADLDALLDGGLDDVVGSDPAGSADPLDDLELPEEDIFADLGMDFDDVDSALEDDAPESSAQDDIDALLSGMDEELEELSAAEPDALSIEDEDLLTGQDDIDSLLAGVGDDNVDALVDDVLQAEEPSVTAEGQDDIDALLNSVAGDAGDGLDDLLDLETLSAAELEDAGDDAELSSLLGDADSTESPFEIEDVAESGAEVAVPPDLEAFETDLEAADIQESAELEMLGDADLDALLADEPEEVSGTGDEVSDLDALLAESAEGESEPDLSDLLTESAPDFGDDVAAATEAPSEIDDLLGQAAGESELEPAMDQAEAMSELEALLGSGELDVDPADSESSDIDGAVSDLEQELAKLSGLELEESGAESESAEDALNALLDEEIVEENADFDALLAEISGDETDFDDDLTDTEALQDIELPVAELGSATLAEKTMSSQAVTKELTANIAHDLVADEAGLEDILADSGAAVELEESSLTEGLSYEEVDGWSLLEATNENDTKLDLVRAYIDMDDHEGAREILQEVMNEGSDQQRQDAQKLLQEIG
uniref:FimV/HubP family polar landmark protein n=1 Tax=Marinobacterium jannaschii TaxID=64970 RepID=UPI00047FFD6E|nr:FimV/HubP family polar landmark protein [Marinobacterium jannaschii]